jgi:malate synthase
MHRSPPSSVPPGVQVARGASTGHHRVLTTEALTFVADLVRTFGPRLTELLARRRERQARLEAGESHDFLTETAHVRTSEWRVFPVRGDLLDRRVEVVRPPLRSDVVHGLNSDANVFVADFEDPHVRAWDDVVHGQLNLFDAIRRTISVDPPHYGERCPLQHRVAVLFVRPRGWDSVEPHITVDGRSVPAALLDFGLFFFHNARELLDHCTAPYFYLPGLESHLEARLWNDIFVHAQRAVGIPRATVKAACLIETVPALFEMDEFLWELREHSCGLHRGRKGLPSAAVKRLVRTCHRRGTHAVGGLDNTHEAQQPAMLGKVRAEKLREVRAGLDGTSVKHPSWIPLAKEVFNAHMPGPNQIGSSHEVHAAGTNGAEARGRRARRVDWPTLRGS